MIIKGHLVNSESIMVLKEIGRQDNFKKLPDAAAVIRIVIIIIVWGIASNMENKDGVKNEFPAERYNGIRTSILICTR